VLGFSKVAFASLTFNVRAEDAEREYFRPFPFGGAGNRLVVLDIHFDLLAECK